MRIIRHLKHAGAVLFGRIDAGRDLTVFPDDTFIVTYPKSGTNWARFLVGNLAYPDKPIGFLDSDPRIPSIYHHPDRALRLFPQPRILASHEFFDPRYRTVIYIVRDPRDVAVSLYHYSRDRGNIPEGYPIDEFVLRFIEGEFVGWIKNGRWRDHVLSWTATREGQAGFLFLRYEDMCENAQRELAKIARLLKIEADPERLARAVELSSSERMRALDNERGSHRKFAGKHRKKGKLVRAAGSGGWRAALPEKSVAAIEAAWGPVMQRFGYEPSTVSCGPLAMRHAGSTASRITPP